MVEQYQTGLTILLSGYFSMQVGLSFGYAYGMAYDKSTNSKCKWVMVTFILIILMPIMFLPLGVFAPYDIYFILLGQDYLTKRTSSVSMRLISIWQIIVFCPLFVFQIAFTSEDAYTSYEESYDIIDAYLLLMLALKFISNILT